MEGVAAMTSATLLFAGATLLPTEERYLGIIFMSLFWAPYCSYKYAERVCGRRPASSKAFPTAPVYTGPLPIAVVVAEEDPV